MAALRGVTDMLDILPTDALAGGLYCQPWLTVVARRDGSVLLRTKARVCVRVLRERAKELRDQGDLERADKCKDLALDFADTDDDCGDGAADQQAADAVSAAEQRAAAAEERAAAAERRAEAAEDQAAKAVEALSAAEMRAAPERNEGVRQLVRRYEPAPEEVPAVPDVPAARSAAAAGAAPPPAGGLLVFIRTETGRVLPVDVPADATWGDLQRAANLGCGAAGLTFQGELHDPDETLADIGVCAQSTLEMRLVVVPQSWELMAEGIDVRDGKATITSRRNEAPRCFMCLGPELPAAAVSAWQILIGDDSGALRSLGVTCSTDLTYSLPDNLPEHSIAYLASRRQVFCSVPGIECEPTEKLRKLKSGQRMCFVLRGGTLHIGLRKEAGGDVDWLWRRSGINRTVRAFFSFYRDNVGNEATIIDDGDLLELAPR
eukprot:TRINITY_DN4210_c0_g1_i1.p1 TRINITY_DN4210_c0_g1~~TRINITY_DN4210_c0_g1_i1.p1  ORF type:complete len:456 (+),score=128.25 TRINITY_DN4210_c0_g1_i1:67-1368(+)